MRNYIFILTVFLVCALPASAEALTLTKLSVVPAIIYPSAALGSGEATSTTITIGLSEKSKVTLSILDATGALVKTIYTSSGVTNPTPKVWDGTNVSGIKVVSGMYTVSVSATSLDSGTAITDTSEQVQVVGASSDGGANATNTDNASSTPVTTSSSSTTYTPPPSSLSIDVGQNKNGLVEVPMHFAALAKTKAGAIDSLAQIRWSFGDGSAGSGNTIDKTYRYAGTYLVEITASDGSALAEDELTVVVAPAQLHIENISTDGIIVANDSNKRLDLSGWRLSAGTGSFRFPPGTILLPTSKILFPAAITGLPTGLDAMLAYPNGCIAARYAPPDPAPVSAATSTVSATVAQLSPSASSSTLVPAVAPIISLNDGANEVATIIAPATTTELGVAGAPLAAAPASAKLPSFVKSPWTLGFLGLLVISGGAFMIL